LVSDLKSEKSVERLSVMKHTRDGYEIAERDLILRGPGDFFSNNSDDILRQSGGFEFKFAKLCDDNKLLEVAFATAKSIAEDDPKLEKSEHLLLRESVKNILQQNISNIS
jgi:ATP-dependent DNA helicase RecG